MKTKSAALTTITLLVITVTVLAINAHSFDSHTKDVAARQREAPSVINVPIALSSQEVQEPTLVDMKNDSDQKPSPIPGVRISIVQIHANDSAPEMNQYTDAQGYAKFNNDFKPGDYAVTIAPTPPPSLGKGSNNYNSAKGYPYVGIIVGDVSVFVFPPNGKSVQSNGQTVW